MKIDSILDLFKGESLVPVLIVVIIAFVLGFVVEMLLSRLFCCKCKKSDAVKSGDQKQKFRRGEERFTKRHPAPADGSIEIYVGNLSYDMTEDQLRAAFEAYGKVNSARIITNRFNNKSKGFGFVHMPNRAEADAAIAALNDKDIGGRKLKCNQARNAM